MSTNFDFDLMAEIAEHAPTAGGTGSFTNYGRVWADNFQVSAWNNDTKSYSKEPYEGGSISNGQTLEFQLHQDTAELNPAFSNENWDGVKTWYVQVKQSGKRAKDKTDWSEYILPAIFATFKDLRNFFKSVSGKGVYAAVEDFATGKTRVQKSTGQEFDITVPKFVTVYKNKNECSQARAERYSKSDEFPAIPTSVLGSFKAFVESCGDVESAREVCQEQNNGEYEGYPFDTILDASGLVEEVE